MNILRNEIRTGLLVVLTLLVLVAVLLYLGAPGVFVPQKTYRIYFDNAAGIKQGAAVLLAGRKVGQVRALYSPVSEKERPTPEMETLIEVQVEAGAKIYNRVKVLMTQTSLLGETIIDFTNGEEASGIAEHNASFLGERPAGVAEAVPAVLERIDPVLTKATSTLEALQSTAANLSKLSAEGSDLQLAFAEYKTFGTNLNELSGPEGSLRRSLGNIELMTSDEGKLGQSLDNIQRLTGKDSPLANTLKNAEEFTSELTKNKDIKLTLRNFRVASERLTSTVSELGAEFARVGENLAQASDTVKRQPWRLIWPTTKKYEDDGRASPPQPRLKVSSSPTKRSSGRRAAP